MRNFISITLLVAIISLGFFVYLVLFGNQASNNPDDTTTAGEYNDLGNATITPVDTGSEPETSQLQTLYGQTIQVNNFKKIAEVNSVGSNMYHLDSTAGYQILFNDNNDSFAINISERPVLATRDRAVQALSRQLNVSLNDLCLLNIYISTTFDFDPTYAGKNIGIEGC